jgi:hypothetical protein
MINEKPMNREALAQFANVCRLYRGHLKTVAKEVLAEKKVEASEGWYVSSAKKPIPLLGEW